MMNRISLVSNRQVPQDKALSFGISSKALNEIMIKKGLAVVTQPLEGTGYKIFGQLKSLAEYNSVLVIKKEGEQAKNVLGSAKTYKGLITKLAKQIRAGSLLFENPDNKAFTPKQENLKFITTV